VWAQRAIRSGRSVATRGLVDRRVVVVVHRAVGAQVLQIAQAAQAEAVHQLAEQDRAAVGRGHDHVAGDADPAGRAALPQGPLELGLARQPEAVGEEGRDLIGRDDAHRRLAVRLRAGGSVVGRGVVVGRRVVVGLASPLRLDRVAVGRALRAAVAGRGLAFGRHPGDGQEVRPHAHPPGRPRRQRHPAAARGRRPVVAGPGTGVQIVDREAHPQPAAGHDHEPAVGRVAQLAQAGAPDPSTPR
jgi:hypothetical protein